MKEKLIVLYDELNILYKFSNVLSKSSNSYKSSDSDKIVVSPETISYIMKRMSELFPDEILPF